MASRLIYTLFSLALLLLTSTTVMADVGITLDVLPTQYIVVTIVSPNNTTYTFAPDAIIQTNYTIHVYDINTTSMNISFFLNGNLIYNNPSAANNSYITSTQNSTAGTHNFTALATDANGNSGTQSVIYTIVKQVAPIHTFVATMIPTVMSAGALIWLLGIFIGSPRDPKELIDFVLISVIVFAVLAISINILVGII